MWAAPPEWQLAGFSDPVDNSTVAGERPGSEPGTEGANPIWPILGETLR